MPRELLKALSAQFNLKVELVGTESAGYRVVIPDFNGDCLVTAAGRKNMATDQARLELPGIIASRNMNANGDANNRRR
jgi:hypothetical protein